MITLQKSKAFAKKAGTEIVDRVNPKTTGGKWKKVRNIAGIVALAGSAIATIPLNLPTSVVLWIKWGTLVAGIIAGRSHLDKSAKK